MSYDTCVESVRINFCKKRDMLTKKNILVHILFLFFFESLFRASTEKEKINEEFWYINVGPNVKSKIP